MKLSRKTVCLHGNRNIYVLTPKNISDKITATDDQKGYFYLMSNGTGYALLSKIFALAISLGENELIYLPLEFAYQKAYEKDFSAFENHYTGVVIFNYCTTQIDGKDILTVLNNKPIKMETISRDKLLSDEFPDRWKTRHRLTVKGKGKLLIMSGNGDIFTSMAQSCENLAEYGDDVEFNKSPPHMHHDWDENTAKSVGITFYYWHHNGGGTTDEQLQSC